MNTGLNDPVFWGSMGAVVVCIVIFVFLARKIVKLMNKDAEAHKNN